MVEALAPVLARWTQTAEATAVPLTGGSEATAYAVRGPGGRFVLRHCGLPDRDPMPVVASLAAAGCAARHGVGAPRPCPTREGEAFALVAGGRCAGLWTLSTWVPGRPRRRWHALAPAQAAALGGALARLHAALRDLPPDMVRPLTGPPARHGRPHDQVLHGDPSPGNVLFGGRDATVDVGFVDFDRVDRGPVERDLARALVGMPPWATPGTTRLARTVLLGYRATGAAVRPARLWEAIDVALEEGARWLDTARLSDAGRRAGARWLDRARRVRITPDELDAIAAADRAAARPAGPTG